MTYPTDQPPPAPDDTASADVGQSNLALLRPIVQKLAYPPFRIVHPANPAIVFTFSSDLTSEKIARFRKISVTNRKNDTVDGQKMNRLILSDTCTEIEANGEVMRNSDGDPANFRDRDLQDMAGVNTGAAAVGFLFPQDGPLNAVAAAVIDKCGFGADVEEDEEGGKPNPT